MANSRCWTAPRPPTCPENRHVIRRIGEHELGALLAEQGLIGLGPGRIAANQPVAADAPDIARPGNSRTGCNLHHCIGRIIIVCQRQFTDQQIDLRQLETGQGNLEIDIEVGKVL